MMALVDDNNIPCCPTKNRSSMCWMNCPMYARDYTWIIQASISLLRRPLAKAKTKSIEFLPHIRNKPRRREINNSC
ncbi:hypothetical protein DSM3645_14680 [Blastopirellula marina DSM 3645]|uniref:Uncharacterized protein n=1 Tax=Blastopirellula marina DSM 3645 TaxID=314230 RepID=A3ZSE0_9BACT|nr:hypothetical protein DSM3645_14680 [Blastopirellula marina DSM 3645]